MLLLSQMVHAVVGLYQNEKQSLAQAQHMKPFILRIRPHIILNIESQWVS